MIKKAVITAAGKGTRQYPATNAVQKELFPLIDLDGIAKPAIQIIAEQALRAGIEEICIVVNPGEAGQFRRHFKPLPEDEKSAFSRKDKSWGLTQSELLNDLMHRIIYVEQTEQHGFGHAVWCAHEFTGTDPFLLLLGDHIYVSNTPVSCISQALDAFHAAAKTVLPACPAPAEQLYLFGTLGADPLPGHPGLCQVRDIIEKPDAETARAKLRTPGLPDDHFLTLFGMYVLTGTIMEILDRHVRENVRSGGEIQLTTALQELNRSEGCVTLEIKGQRLDMGTPAGYLETQTVLARRGALKDRFEEFLKI